MTLLYWDANFDVFFLKFVFEKNHRIENSKMSEKSENSKEKVEGAVATEKAATDANKEEEKVDLVSEKWELFLAKNRC